MLGVGVSDGVGVVLGVWVIVGVAVSVGVSLGVSVGVAVGSGAAQALKMNPVIAMRISERMRAIIQTCIVFARSALRSDGDEAIS